jgi:alcohol dehydrogenase
MRRLEYVRRGELRWADVREARVQEPGDAVVRPIASTTCDLDRAIIAGATPFVGPFAIGHECVAEVVDIGDGAATLRPGQQVVVPWHICCGLCARCGRGLTSQCERVPRYAMYGVPLGGDWGGLFDELVRVPWASQALVPLPEGLDPALVASASDNLTDAWRAVGPALRAAPGARVLIMGGTPSIGLYVAMFAAAVGAGAIDYVDRSAQRRTQASALGATPHETTPAGEEYEIIVDASADRGALAEGLRHAAPGARCHSVGIFFGDPTPLPLDVMYMHGVTLTTGRPDVLADIPDVLDLVADGTVDPAPIFSGEIAWEDAPAALAELPRKPLVLRSGR